MKKYTNMEVKKNITAVEWLERELISMGIYIGETIYDKAKEMERKQIIEAYNQMRCVGNFENGEQYYNETYGNK